MSPSATSLLAQAPKSSATTTAVMCTRQHRSRQLTKKRRSRRIFSPNLLLLHKSAFMSESSRPPQSPPPPQQNHRASRLPVPSFRNLHFSPHSPSAADPLPFNGKSNYTCPAVVFPFTAQPIPRNVNNQTGQHEFMHKMAAAAFTGPLMDADLFTTEDQHHHHRPSGINYRKLNKQDYQLNNCTVDNLPTAADADAANAAAALLDSIQSVRQCSLAQTGQVKLKIRKPATTPSAESHRMPRKMAPKRGLIYPGKANNASQGVAEFNFKSHLSLSRRCCRRRRGHVQAHQQPRMLPFSPSSSSALHLRAASNQLPTRLASSPMDNLQFNSSVDFPGALQVGRLSPPPPPRSTTGLNLATHQADRPVHHCSSTGHSSSVPSSVHPLPAISSSIDSMPPPANVASASSSLLHRSSSVFLPSAPWPPEHEQIWKTNLVSSSTSSPPPNGHHHRHHRHDGASITSANDAANVKPSARAAHAADTGNAKRHRRPMQPRIGQQPAEELLHFDKSSSSSLYSTSCSRASYFTGRADDSFSSATARAAVAETTGAGSTLKRRKYVDRKIDNDTAQQRVATAPATQAATHSSDNDCKCSRDEELPRAARAVRADFQPSAIGNLCLNLNNEVDEKIERHCCSRRAQSASSSSTSCPVEPTGKQLFNLSSQLSRLPLALSAVPSVNPLSSALVGWLLKSTHSTPVAAASSSSLRAFALLSLWTLLLLSSASFHPTTFAMAASPDQRHSAQSAAVDSDFAASPHSPLAGQHHRAPLHPQHPHPSISIMNDANHRSERNVKSPVGLGADFLAPGTTSTRASSATKEHQRLHSIDELLSADLFDDIRLLLPPVHGPPLNDDDRYRKEAAMHHWTCVPSATAFASSTRTWLLDAISGEKDETNTTTARCLCWPRLTSNYAISLVPADGTVDSSRRRQAEASKAMPTDRRPIFGRVNEAKRTIAEKWLKKLNSSTTTSRGRTKVHPDKRFCATMVKKEADRLTAALRWWHFVRGKLLETITQEATAQFDIKMDLDLLSEWSLQQPTAVRWPSSSAPQFTGGGSEGAEEGQKTMSIKSAEAMPETSISGTVTTSTATEFKAPPNGPNSSIEVSETKRGGGDPQKKANGTSDAVNVKLVAGRTAANSRTVNDDERNRGNATNGERWGAQRRTEEKDADKQVPAEGPNDYDDYEDAEKEKEKKVASLLRDCRNQSGLSSLTDDSAERSRLEQLKNCLPPPWQRLVMMIYVNDELPGRVVAAARTAPAASSSRSVQQWQDMNAANRGHQTNDVSRSRSLAEQEPEGEQSRKDGEDEEEEGGRGQRVEATTVEALDQWKVWRRLSKCSPSPKSQCICRVIESEKLRLQLNGESPGKGLLQLPERTELHIWLCSPAATTDGHSRQLSSQAASGSAQTRVEETNVDSDLLWPSLVVPLKPKQVAAAGQSAATAAAAEARQNVGSGNNSSIQSCCSDQSMADGSGGSLAADAATQSVTRTTSSVSSVADRDKDKQQQQQHDERVTRQQSKRNRRCSGGQATGIENENLPDSTDSASVHPVSSGQQQQQQSFESAPKVHQSHQRVRQQNGSLPTATPLPVDGTPTSDLFSAQMVVDLQKANNTSQVKSNSESSEADEHKWPLWRQVDKGASKLAIEAIEIDRLVRVKSMEDKSSTNVNPQLKLTASAVAAVERRQVDSAAISGRSMRIKRTVNNSEVEKNGIENENGNVTASGKPSSALDGLVDSDGSTLLEAAVRTVSINKVISNEGNDTTTASAGGGGPPMEKTHGKLPSISATVVGDISTSTTSTRPHNDLNWPVASESTGEASTLIVTASATNLSPITEPSANFTTVSVSPTAVNSTFGDIFSRPALPFAVSASSSDQTLLKSHSTNLVASVNRLPQDILQHPAVYSASSGRSNAPCNFTTSATNNNESFICAHSPTSTTAQLSLPSSSSPFPSSSSAASVDADRLQWRQSLSSTARAIAPGSSVNKQASSSPSESPPVWRLSLNNLTTTTTTTGHSHSRTVAPSDALVGANDAKLPQRPKPRHRNDQAKAALLDPSSTTTTTDGENVELLGGGTPAKARGDKKWKTTQVEADGTVYQAKLQLQATAISPVSPTPTTGTVSSQSTVADMWIINDDLNANNRQSLQARGRPTGDEEQEEQANVAALERQRRIKLPPDCNRLNQNPSRNDNKAASETTTTVDEDNYGNSRPGSVAKQLNLSRSGAGANNDEPCSAVDDDGQPLKTSDAASQGRREPGGAFHSQTTERGRLESKLTSEKSQTWSAVEPEPTRNWLNMTRSWPSYGANDAPSEATTVKSLDVNDIQLGSPGGAAGTGEEAANNSLDGRRPMYRDSHRQPPSSPPPLTASDSEQEQQSSRFKVSTTSSSTWKPDEGARAKTGSIISDADTEAMTDGKLAKTAAEISRSTTGAGEASRGIASSSSSSSAQHVPGGSPSEAAIDPLLAPFALATASDRYCPPGIDQANLTWARTDAGVLALLPCQPTARYSGTVYRPCYSTGKWGTTDLTDCRLKQLKELHRLVLRHVQKHLLDGLVPLTLQLKHLLLPNPIVPLLSPLDRIDALAALHSILVNSKIKIRIDSDQEEERRTIQFVQALVLLSEHLLIGTKSVQFPADSDEQNLLLLGQLVETLHSFRVTMENLLRALILSCQDGSIKTLLLQPTPLLPSNLPFIEINLSQRKPSLLTLLPLVSSRRPTVNQSILLGTATEKPKLSINFQNFSHVGVGVAEIWLHALEGSLDRGSDRVVSDLLCVSILPAVSIEVDFEVAPKFEVLLPLHGTVREEEQHQLPESGDAAQPKTHHQAVLDDELEVEVAKKSPKVGNEGEPSGEHEEDEDEEAELRRDYGWSSNQQNRPVPVRAQTEQKVKIGCGRMLTNAHGPSIWTAKGCQTATLSARYLKCICTEPGIIAAVTFPVVFEAPEKTAEIDSNLMNDLPNRKIHILDMEVNLDGETLKSATANLATTNLVAHRQFLYGNHLKRRLSSYDITLYISLIASILFLLVTLIIQFRLRKYETRETFFIVRNLVLTLLLIQLTFLFGTTFHMDLFWIRVAQLSPSLETPTFYRVKHSLCLSVPVFLHFIHLASLFWMLSHSILLYQRFWRPIIPPPVDTTSHENNSAQLPTIKQQRIITPKSKRSKSHDFLSANANQLCSTSKECRRRYLKQTKSFLRKKKLNKLPLIRLLNSIYTVLIYPFGRISLLIKSLSFVAHFTSKHSPKHSAKTGDNCELQMENIPTVQANNQVKPSSANGALQPHHLNHCANQSTEQINLPAHDQQSSDSANLAEKTAKAKHETSHQPLASSLFNTWKCPHFIALSMGLPFILVLLSYILNKRGYETRRYCWMSIEGGIQYSFIIPVLVLITTNTLLMLLVLKRYFERKLLTHRAHLDQIRPSLRASIILLPFFSFNWFLSVLSLETLTTSPFELIFALTNWMHSFLVFYFHCYQRYNIHYFIKVRWVRLHLKRRIAKLFYRLISVLNVRWCPTPASAISRSSSFNWSDFGQNENFKDDASPAPDQQRTETTQPTVRADYPKHNHQLYHAPPPIEYKCNTSGLYCNHCYCVNNCHSAYPAEMSPKQGVHSSFYCNCSPATVEAAEFGKGSNAKSMDCFTSHHCAGHDLPDQRLFDSYGNVPYHSCNDHNGALVPSDGHCLRSSFNVSHSFDSQLKDHYLSEKSQSLFQQQQTATAESHLSLTKLGNQFWQFAGEEDEEVVIVELDEDEDDIIDGSDDEEEESDEVVDDDDEEMAELASSLSLNDFMRKNY